MKRRKFDIRGTVLMYLKKGKYTKFEISEMVYRDYGFWYDPGTIHSRIRDLRMHMHGGYKIPKEEVEGKDGVFYYWIEPQTAEHKYDNDGQGVLV